MGALEVQLPKPLKRRLRRYAQTNGITLEAAVIQAIDTMISAPPPDDRLESIEARLNRLEERVEVLNTVPASDREALRGFEQERQEQTGLFLTDEEQVSRRDQAYRTWLDYFNSHPDSLEPGRSAHEMAALKASVV